MQPKVHASLLRGGGGKRTPRITTLAVIAFFAAAGVAAVALTSTARAQDAPGPVTDLKASGGAGLATLTWSEVDDADGYQIFRQGADGEAPSPIANVRSGQSAYTHQDTGADGEGLEPGEYRYWIQTLPGGPVTGDGGGAQPAIATVTEAEDTSPKPAEDAKLEISGPQDVKFKENGEGAVATYTVGYSDGTSADDVTLGIGDWVDSHLFTLDGNDLKFISPPDYEDPQDRQGKNVYRVQLVSTDESRTDKLRVRVKVRNVNEVVNICDRTPAARDAIMKEVNERNLHIARARWIKEGRPGGSFTPPPPLECHEATENLMKRVRFIHITATNTLNASDLADLPNLRTLWVQESPDLTSVPSDLLDGLTKLRIFELDGTGVTSLTVGLIDHLPELTTLLVAHHEDTPGLESLPEGMLEILPEYHYIELSDGSVYFDGTYYPAPDE